MQTILIATDFSATSFDFIPALCKQYKGSKLTIIFSHLFKLSDSISDLLMLSRRNKEYQFIPDEFYQQCNKLKKQNEQIAQVKIEFFYGSTMSAFKEFLNAHRVNAILDPQLSPVRMLNNLSINPATLLEKAAITGISIIKPERYIEERSTVILEENILEEVQH